MKRKRRLQLGVLLITVFCFHSVGSTFCNEAEYRCPNGTCIPLSKVKDGVEDCEGGLYDESGPVCRDDEVPCARDGKCIPRDKMEDGINHCGDNSDEFQYPCPRGQFACKDSGPADKCIPMQFLWDSLPDCADGSDEDLILGAPCTTNTTACELHVPNSRCHEELCQCAPGHVAIGVGECVQIQLGDKCRDEADCQVTSPSTMTCQEGVCTCAEGYERSQNKTTCEKGMPDVPCQDDSDCSAILHSRCHDNHCRCHPGHVFQPDSPPGCSPRHLGDACDLDTDCSVVVDNSRCGNNGTCVCAVGFQENFFASSDIRCVQRTLGNSCDLDEDCGAAVRGSSCQGGVCRCAVGYRFQPADNSCSRFGLGSECFDDAECSSAVPHSRCDVSMCWCETGYAVTANRTCSLMTVGSRCTRDADCGLAVPHAACRDGECRCESGYETAPLANSTSCERMVLGSACAVDSECAAAMSNSACVDDQCACQPGFVRSAENSTCVERGIGTICATDSECETSVQNSLCSEDGTCACAPGYKNIRDNNNNSDNQTCVEVVGSQCDADAECSDFSLNTACVNETCACQRGFELALAPPHGPLSSSCQLRRTGSACESDLDCSAAMNGSACVDSACQCVLGYRDSGEGGSSCQKLKVGDHCEDTTHCQAAFGGSICYDHMCLCLAGYRTLDDRAGCEKHHVGSACRDDLDCTLAFDFSRCSSNDTCECVTGYQAAEDGYACARRRIGDPTCDADPDCSAAISNSFCHSGTCRCLLGYILSDDPDLCRERQFGDLCDKSLDCETAVNNSVCVNERCACKVGHRALDNSTCSRVVIGDWCESNEECNDSVYGSVCEEGSCACWSGFKAEKDGLECRIRQLGDDCNTSTDCSRAFRHSTCHPHGRCVCLPGHRADDVSTCTRRKVDNSSACLTDDDCHHAVNNSFCDRDNDNGSSSSNSNRNADGVEGEGTCACKLGYRAAGNDTLCLLRRIGDSPCAADEDCSAAVPDSECDVYGQCACALGFHPRHDLAACDKRVLGDPTCVIPEDCSAAVANSTCSEDFVCICRLGYEGKAGDSACALRVIGSACVDDVDCSAAFDHGECGGGGGVGVDDGRCGCAVGYRGTDDGEGCVVRVLGDACNDSRDCTVGVAHATCTQERCTCLPNFKPADIAAVGRTCVPRLWGDKCSADTDCDNVEGPSQCKTGICTCKDGHDVMPNGTACVQRPQMIGQRCYFPTQCIPVHPASLCHPDMATCRCPDDHYVTRSRTVCQRKAEKLGEPCERKEHCSNIANSSCNTSTGQCRCVLNFFADHDDSVCSPYPRQLGERCTESLHCQRFMEHTECAANKTCVCVYGYMPSGMSPCIERPIIEPPQLLARPAPVNCSVHTGEATHITADNPSACNAAFGRICVPDQENKTQGTCECPARSRSDKCGQDKCLGIQTYQVTFNITQVAGRYDFLPLNFTQLLSDAAANRGLHVSCRQTDSATFADPLLLDVGGRRSHPLADRVTLTGVNVLMRRSSVGRRFVDSEVVNMSDLHPGMQVTTLLHVTETYYNPLPSQTVFDSILDELKRSDGEVGDSRLKVAEPFSGSFKVEDFNECATPLSNDCSPNAWCINTLGSYFCVCHVGYDDTSVQKNLPKGRECIITGTTEDYSESCSTDTCETNWNHVALILAGFFLAITAMIVYEICQRHESNTARDLYERFGTTSIRRLRRAVSRARELRTYKPRDHFWARSRPSVCSM